MTVVEHPLLVLTPRPWKWLGVLAIGLLFVVVGWWMAHHAAEPFQRGVGWFGLVFFGLIALVALIQLVPGTSRVVVTTQGIYVKTFLRSHHVAWQEVECFGVAEWTQWHGPFRQRHRQVGIRFKDGGAVRKKRGRSTMLAEALLGYHGTLPDNYGYKHQELADMLNRLLAKHRQ